MKKVIVLTFFVFLVLLLNAQPITLVSWKVSCRKLKANRYRVFVKATIEQGWHIYSHNQPKDAIGVPVSFAFSGPREIKLRGPLIEKGNKEVQSFPELGIKQFFYANEVNFVQEVDIVGPIPMQLEVTVNYMCCSGDKCLPETNDRIKFSIE